MILCSTSLVGHLPDHALVTRDVAPLAPVGEFLRNCHVEEWDVLSFDEVIRLALSNSGQGVFHT